jgi:bilin biosynthesis protein
MQKGKNAYRMVIRGVFLLACFLLLFPTSAFLQGEKGVEELISDLQDEKPLVRAEAAEQLGRLKDVRTVEPLIEALRDEDKGVRREVTKALGEIGDSRAVKPLEKMLGDIDEFVRMNALWALERIGGDEAVDMIIVALKNDNPLVRMNASTSLGRTGNKKAIGPLEEVAKMDAQSYVRFAAQQALAQIRAEMLVKPPAQAPKQKTVADAHMTPLIAEMTQVAERIHEEYGLMLDYTKYDIMDLLDIEARMKMRHPRDTIENVLGDLLTPEDKERNRHLFEKKD